MKKKWTKSIKREWRKKIENETEEKDENLITIKLKKKMSQFYLFSKWLYEFKKKFILNLLKGFLL